MLKLRRGTVVEIRRAHDDLKPAVEQRLVVELAGAGGAGARREAIADTALVGQARVGDEVIVNTQALDLGLGSGGFDIVHVNLTRGLSGEGDTSGADPSVMKLNY